MTQCKEGAQKEGLMLDSHEELYKWFTSQVIRNLHVVFTMNPSSEGLKDRAATSPALFNRYAVCTRLWVGTWVSFRGRPCRGRSETRAFPQVCAELVWGLVHGSALSSWQGIHQQDGPGEAKLHRARLHAGRV